MTSKAKPSAKPDAAKRKSRHTKRDDPEQSERFIKAAREHGADESGDSFRRAVDRTVKPAQ